jgi:hypothetical protein
LITEINEKISHLVFEKEQPFYDVWMMQSNDEIQGLATAFSDRYFLENAIKALESDCIHKGAYNILYKVIMLDMLTNILANLGFYLSHDLISISAAQ